MHESTNAAKSILKCFRTRVNLPMFVRSISGHGYKVSGNIMWSEWAM